MIQNESQQTISSLSKDVDNRCCTRCSTLPSELKETVSKLLDDRCSIPTSDSEANKCVSKDAFVSKDVYVSKDLNVSNFQDQCTTSPSDSDTEGISKDLHDRCTIPSPKKPASKDCENGCPIGRSVVSIATTTTTLNNSPVNTHRLLVKEDELMVKEYQLTLKEHQLMVREKQLMVNEKALMAKEEFRDLISRIRSDRTLKSSHKSKQGNHSHFKCICNKGLSKDDKVPECRAHARNRRDRGMTPDAHHSYTKTAFSFAEYQLYVQQDVRFANPRNRESWKSMQREVCLELKGSGMLC